MIGNLRCITVAVPDLNAAIRQYQTGFDVFVSSPQNHPDHGIQLAQVKLPNTLLEFIAPLGENSPLETFLKENPQGGIHHLCYEVASIEKVKNQLAFLGIRPLGEGTPEPGYHGHPTLFFSPQECLGIPIQLEEAPSLGLAGRVEIDRIGPIHTAHPRSSNTLEGVEGIGLGIKVDFKRSTPKDNKERE